MEGKKAPDPGVVGAGVQREMSSRTEVDMAELYALERMVFPDSDFMREADLFYREEKVYADLGNGKVIPGKRCSFDTWMNLFAAKKWYKYCDLGNLYLRITGTGRYRLDIQGHGASVIHGAMTENLVSLPCDLGRTESTRIVQVPDPSGWEGISFSLSFEKDEDFCIAEAAWCTDLPPQRRHRLAVVCCTFRREPYVRKNIRKFEELMASYPELEGRLHLFVADNGRTLPESLSGPHVDILPNVNAGGAGGFGRGLMAANDGGYTRCLFMDDDVEICPESLLRTLALTEYFKEEQKDAFVNGAMMSLYDRTLCSESVTVRNEFWLKGYHDHVPVRDLYGVLKCVNVSDSIYEETFVSSSWWFACFSLELYKDEYPIPCFIRGDDCEWSWRRLGVHHVSMNGICVWHTPFDFNTRRLIDHYFLPRNMLFVHAVYNPDFKKEFFGYINGFYQHFMDTYNYTSMELVLSALREVLKGWRCFTEDAVALMARLKKICSTAEVTLCDDIEKLEKIRRFDPCNPPEDESAVVDWFPRKEAFARRERVDVYNVVTGTCETRRLDRERQEWQMDEFEMLMLQLHTEYDAWVENLKYGFGKLTNRAFWNSYLGLASGREEQEKAGSVCREIPAQDRVDLLEAVADAFGRMGTESPEDGEVEALVEAAVDHQAVLVLEQCWAKEWQQLSGNGKEREPQEQAAQGDRKIRIQAAGLSVAAAGMDFLREAGKEGFPDEAEFFRRLACFCKEHEPSEESLGFLRECLRASAGKYSGFRTIVQIEAE